jgi:DNA-binding response OmpR family regulator
VTPKPTRPRSVLHVEDYEPARALRAEILKKAGFRVISVGTARDALAAVAKERPDVVLCDVKLPDGTGFHVCREIHTRHPDLPVVLVSAIYRDEFTKGSAAYIGASDYLVEPISATELVAAITRQIG